MRLQRSLGLGLLLVAACGSSDKNRTLTSLSPAMSCEGGGVTISTGVDDNGNGVLDEAEIDSTQTVCTTAIVQRVDPLPPGDECPNGGNAVRWGVDDNGNGSLQDTEIDHSEVRCDAYRPVVVPAGTPGTAQIFLDGGDASTGNGGQSGYMRIDAGPSGGWLALFETGSVDADYTVPTRANQLGTAMTVTAVLDVPHRTDNAVVTGLVDGQHFTFVNPTTSGVELRRFATGATTLNAPQNVRITGINVGPDGDLSFAFPSGQLVLADDVVNAGTIRSKATGFYLNIGCRAYIGAVGSEVLTVSDVGNGGTLALDASEIVVNAGNLDASGDDASSGGHGGSITLRARAGSVFNEGSITSRGGDGGDGTAGNGGEIYLLGRGGMVGNKGTLDASGGESTGNGGEGGYIELSSDPADVRNSGTLTSNGGAAEVGCATCRGGHGGTIQLEANGGALVNNAAITAVGGLGQADGGCGGNGGALRLYTGVGRFQTPSQGVLRFTGTIDLRGADGGAGDATNCGGARGGGVGGNIYGTLSPVFPLAQEMAFYGYSHVYARGGDGANGGSAGFYDEATIELVRRGRYFASKAAIPADPAPVNNAAVIGGIANYVDIDVTGGNATGSTTQIGGYGGAVWLYYQTDQFVDSGLGVNRVVNAGTLTSQGGNGPIGGHAYGFLLHGPEGVENSAALSSRAGQGTVDSDTAGVGGSNNDHNGLFTIALSSDVGTVTNTGALTAAAGQGVRAGGSSEAVCIEGAEVSNTAPLAATGGNVGVASGPNGNGGDIRLTSYLGGTQNTGTTSTAAGTGGVGGLAGTVYVDSLLRCYSNFNGYR